MRMCNKLSWKDLARIDAKLTAEFFDGELIRTHKVPIEDDTDHSSGLEKQWENKMRADYLSFSEFFELRPLTDSFSKDSQHSSLGVFSKINLKKNEILKGLTGFLAPMPQSSIVPGLNDVSIIQHASGPKLMLGGASFINSSCKENCIYVPNKSKTMIQIRVTAVLGVQKGEEITVNYGGEYFGPNRMFCECPHASLHGHQPVTNSWTRSGRVKPVVAIPTSSSLIDETASSLVVFPSLSSTPYSQSKRQFKQRSNCSYNSRRIRKRRYLSKKAKTLISDSESEKSESSSCNGFIEQPSLSQVPENTDSFQQVSESSVLANPFPVESSTPRALGRVDNMIDSSSLSESETQTDETLSDSDSLICDNSKMSVSEFTDTFLSLSDEFAISDRFAKSLISLMDKCLPMKNNLPTFYRLQQIENTSFTCEEEKVPGGVICHLNVESQLVGLIERNLDLLRAPNWQLNNDVRLETKSDCEVLHFVMSTDGVSPAKSKRFSLYPVWLMLLNLPRKRRVSYRNLILVSLFGGDKKPDCTSLVKNLVGFVNAFNKRRLLTVGKNTYNVLVNIRLVAVDAIMKAPLLNQTQFNGLYGCSNCYIPGASHPSGKPWLYKYEPTPSDIRTHTERQNDLSFNPSQKAPRFGLKGISCIEQLVSIPEDVVIDYMHQVLLGVVKRSLYSIVCQKGFNKILKEIASKRLLNCKLPSNDYNRQLRGVDSVKLWKASELKLFLLYGFISFYGLLSDQMFTHFFLLSASIRLLLDPDTEKDIDVAAKSLATFRKQLVRFYGDKSETYNAHSLSHLADQVKRCGPLSTSSSIAFEAAHFQLKRRISETTSTSVFTRLAIKRHNRLAGRKRDFHTNVMAIGSVVLRNSHEVAVNVGDELAVFRSSSAFSFLEKNFYCHNSKCRYLENGSCVHIVKFEREDKCVSFGQLLAIYVDIENCCGVAHVKFFEEFKSFRELLSERFQQLEASSIDNIDMDSDLDESLELLNSTAERHFVVESLTSEIFEIDITKLLAPCIVRSIGDLVVISEICSVFERD